MTVPGSEPFDWAVRVVAVGPSESRAYARNHTITIGQQASFKPSDPHPSAVEYLLAALGGDLLAGLRVVALKRNITLEAAEISLSGKLDNPLVHLGVIGETGHPGLAGVEGTLYVSTYDTDEAGVEALWKAALERSPVYHTLSRAARIAIALRVTP